MSIIKRIQLNRLEKKLMKLSDRVLEIQSDVDKGTGAELERLLKRIREIEYKAKRILNWNLYNQVSRLEKKSDRLKSILFEERNKIIECKILRIRGGKPRDEIINL